MAVLSAMYKKKFIACPYCGTITTVSRIGGFWKDTKCPNQNCGKTIQIDSLRRSLVTCLSCGNKVAYNVLDDSPSHCPNCHNPLINPINARKFRYVPCPHCGGEVDVSGFGGRGQARCALCRNQFDIAAVLARIIQQESGKSVLIECAPSVTDILWKHPQNSFPFGSVLVVKEGATAILLQDGRCQLVAGPGRYDLQESPLTLSDKLQQHGDMAYLTDVFFVQNQIVKKYLWGTPFNYKISDAIGTYSISAHGSVQLRVCDPKALAENISYANTDVSAGDAWIEEYVTLQIVQFFGQELQNAVQSKGWEIRSLTNTDVQDMMIPYVNGRLNAFGLEIKPGTFVVEALIPTETEESRKLRTDKEKLRNIFERRVEWKSGTLTVHMKDQKELYATVVLNGQVTPRVDSLETLYDSSLGQNSGALNALIHPLSGKLNGPMTDMLSQILQTMVDDTGVDIRELSRYYSYLKKTMTDCLNDSYQRFGISFGDMTIIQAAFVPSPRFKGMTQVEDEKARLTQEEEIRRYTQNIRLVEKQETGRFEVEMLRAEVEKAQEKDPLLETRAKMEENQQRRDEEKQVRKMESDTRLSLKDLDDKLSILEKQMEIDLAREENKVRMRDILHKIDESDLTWRQKLEEYERLSAAAKRVEEARADYEAGHIGLKLTAEEKELLHRFSELDDLRVEKAKQADFERDLQMKKAEWEAEAARLQSEYELGKYKAILDYMSKDSLLKMHLEQAKARAEREYAERLRAQKERDDSTFFSRSESLISQMKAFRDTLSGNSADMKDAIDRVIPKTSFDALLHSLESMVASVSSASRSAGKYDAAAPGDRNYTGNTFGRVSPDNKKP